MSAETDRESKTADRWTPFVSLAVRTGLIEAVEKAGSRAFAGVYVDSDQQTAPENEERALGGFLQGAERSEVLVWLPGMWNAAVAGAEAFGDLASPSSVFEGGEEFWLAPRLWNLPREACEDMGLAPGSQGLFLLLDRTTWFVRKGSDERAVVVWMGSVPLHPDDLSPGDFASRASELIQVRRVACFMRGKRPLGFLGLQLAAALCFLTSKVAGKERASLPRQYLRNEARHGRRVPEVNTVVLRRRDRPASQTVREAVEWSCQWLVKGHWRKLCEPRKSDGAQVTYVQPYVKGPEDKPLRPPRETVYTVAR